MAIRPPRWPTWTPNHRYADRGPRRDDRPDRGRPPRPDRGPRRDESGPGPLRPEADEAAEGRGRARVGCR